jgi:hypothetical protein
MPLWGWGPGGGGGGAGAYTSPTVAFIKHVTKLTGKIEGITEAALDADLAEFIPQAEAATAFAITPALFDSAVLTARQVYALQVSVAYRVGAYYLRGVASQIATGTGAPRKTETAAALSDLADLWDNDDPPGEAQRWDDKVMGTVGAGEGGTDPQPLETGELLPGPDSLDWYRSSWLGQDTVEVW